MWGLGNRGITQRIFLGYLLPLLFLFVIGVLGPILLAQVSQQWITERDGAIELRKKLDELRVAAIATEQHGGDYLLTGQPRFRERLEITRTAYQATAREARRLVAPESALEKQIIDADTQYKIWFRRALTLRLKMYQQGEWQRGAKSISKAFAPVRQAFNDAAELANVEARERSRRAEFWDGIRSGALYPVLGIAIVVALLIGRLISLSITQPLEDLRRATEEIETHGTLRRASLASAAQTSGQNRRGGANPPAILDEIAQLEASFVRMAQTVEQRRALLQAQNEALSALNRRVEAVLDTTTDGIVMLDRSGAFSVVSRRFGHFFGVEPERLLSRTYDSVAPLIRSRFRHPEQIRARFYEILHDPFAIADEIHELTEPLPRVLRIYSAPVVGRRKLEAAPGDDGVSTALETSSASTDAAFVPQTSASAQIGSNSADNGNISDEIGNASANAGNVSERTSNSVLTSALPTTPSASNSHTSYTNFPPSPPDIEPSHPIPTPSAVPSAQKTDIGATRHDDAPARTDDGGPSDEPELLGRIFVFRDVTREVAVDTMKTEFVSTVSHELRTPLTAIRGYIDLIVSGRTGDINDVQREFLTIVQNSTARLTALINDMLDISRIESGKIEVQQRPVDYLRVVRSAVEMMRQEAERKNLTLTARVAGARGEASDVPTIWADPDRVTQVLVNLISNGIKYTPPGGAVTVIVEPEETFVTTCVLDTGIGISANDVPRLFTKFFRADNRTTREVGGTGLGLAISKAILEKLNGSVWVESKLGIGSRFYFTLPASATAAVAGGSLPGDIGEIPIPAPGTVCGVILTVSDDETHLRALNRTLRQNHYLTVSATDASEAVNCVRERRPDAVVLDVSMPSRDGLALLQELREPGLLPRDLCVFALALQVRRGGAGEEAEIRDQIAFVQKPILKMDIREMMARGLRPGGGGGGTVKRQRHVVVVGISLAEPVRAAMETLMREWAIEYALDNKTEAEPIRCEFVNGQNDAERLARHSPPDLIVVDADGLPDGSARGLIAALWRTPATAGVRFIVASAKPVSQMTLATPFGSGAQPLNALVAQLHLRLTPPSLDAVAAVSKQVEHER